MRAPVTPPNACSCIPDTSGTPAPVKPPRSPPVMPESASCLACCCGDKAVAKPPSGVASTPPKPVVTVKGLNCDAAAASWPIAQFR